MRIGTRFQRRQRFVDSAVMYRLQQSNILVAPGVYDGLTAAIATDAGFETLYLSGAGVAYTRLGRPDIGLSTSSEMADTMALIADRTALPVIIDAASENNARLYQKFGFRVIKKEEALGFPIYFLRLN